MPQGLNKVKRRILTVENTKKITNAMKLISSVKVRQIQNGFNARLTFLNDLKEVLNIIGNASYATSTNPLLKGYKGTSKTLYIVVSSCLGLCGSYNYNVIRYFENIYKSGDEVITIGDKIDKEVLKDQNITLYSNFKDVLNNLTMSNCRVLQKFILDKFYSGNYKDVVLVYTKYINQIACKVETLKLLPLEFKKIKSMELDSPDFGQNLNFLLDKFAKKYLTSAVYIKFYESILSEQSSRRNAMDNADKNAEELVDKLKIEYNKARQTAITQEITEVVSGSVNK